MNDYPGILIAIDGIDGAGKTTQVRLLESAMLGVGETVIVSKEPTDGEWGQKLRDSALQGRMPVEQELEAFIYDRQDHLKNKVIPALKAGSVVILDRYFYSTIAYQGILLANYTTIEQRIRANVVVPDAAFWLDLPADIAVGRVTARDGQPNLFERQEDLLRAGEIFRSISKSDTKLRQVDGSLPVESLHRLIVDDLVSGCLKDKRCRKSYGCDDPVYCVPRLTNTCRWWSIKRQLTPSRSPSA